METLVHENLHGLGHWKIPGWLDAREFIAAYNTPIGRILQEGAVEYTATKDYREIWRRIGFKNATEPKSYTEMVYGPGFRGRVPHGWGKDELVENHVYKTEVSMVERLCVLASNKANNYKEGEKLDKDAQEHMHQVLFKQKPTERVEYLAEQITKHAKAPRVDNDGGLARAAVHNAAKDYMDKVLPSKRSADVVQADIRHLLTLDTRKEVSDWRRRVGLPGLGLM